MTEVFKRTARSQRWNMPFPVYVQKYFEAYVRQISRYQSGSRPKQ